MTDRATNIAVIIIAACVLVLTVTHLVQGVLPSRSVGAALKPVDSDLWQSLVRGGHTLGSAEAPLILVEFGDFQCPACRASVLPIKQLLAQFPNDLRFVYRHWPLSYHKEAYAAALSAERAGAQGSFWPMHDLLYETQDSLGRIPYTQLGARLSALDTTALRECMTTGLVRSAIDADSAMARRAGRRGTPALFLNGVPVSRGDLDSAFVAKAWKAARK